MQTPQAEDNRAATADGKALTLLKGMRFISDTSKKAPRKRLFIGLVTGSAVLLCLLLLVGWAIPYVGFANIHASIPYITGIVFSLIIITIIWAAFTLVLQIMTGKALWGASQVRGFTIRIFLPLMEMLARLVGIPTDEVRRSFIKVNNELALAHAHRLDPERVLILLPHCLQHAACVHRLNYSVDACVRCGRCPMAKLLGLRDKYGVRLAVATGGTIARRIVVETKPRFIIAVACERDLTSGIQDTHPLPVFGILNARPEGPCHNTTVTLQLVEDALQRFIRPEALAIMLGKDGADRHFSPL